MMLPFLKGSSSVSVVLKSCSATASIALLNQGKTWHFFDSTFVGSFLNHYKPRSQFSFCPRLPACFLQGSRVKVLKGLSSQGPDPSSLRDALSDSNIDCQIKE